MSGLALWAFFFAKKGYRTIGGILFVLAVNFKQMALYYSIPFGAFYLGAILG
jgi:hypothetical protein